MCRIEETSALYAAQTQDDWCNPNVFRMQGNRRKVDYPVKQRPETVVSLLRCSKKHHDLIEEVFQPAAVLYPDRDDPASLIEAMKQADIALFDRNYDPTQFDAPRLKWVHINQSGIEPIAKPHVISSPIAVTSAAGRSAPVLAEHALYFMLSICYRGHVLAQAQHAGYWGFPQMQKRRGLCGKSLLIIGMGMTAHELAKYCVVLGMNVAAFRRKDLDSGIEGVKTYSVAAGDNLDDLLSAVDVVALAASLNDTSYKILNEDRLQNLKPGASVVNVARGGLVDEEALLECLLKGHISGYGSDVFSKQPLDPDHPFRRLNNVYMSPHNTPQMPDRMGRCIDIIKENHRRLLAGKEMLNRLKPEDAFTIRKRTPKALPEE